MKKMFYFLITPIFFFMNTNILYSAEKTNIPPHVVAVEKKPLSLVEAVLSNDLKTITEIINNGTDLERDVKDGMTVLMLAAERSSLETVKLLVEKGANVNAVNTYIRETCYIKNFNSSEQHFNSDHNAGRIYENIGMNRTVLMYALNNKNIKVAEFLLDKGADITSRDMYGKDVLFYAVAKNNPRIIELLIDRGAIINASNRYALLQYATENKNFETINFIISKGININERDRNGNTVLMEAARFGKTEIVKFLISKGADINAVTNDKKNALFFAVENYASKDALETVKFLAANGININLSDEKGENVLFHALKNKNGFIFFQYLITDKKMAVNIKNKYNKTLLMSAIEADNIKAFDFIIEKNVNINEKDIDGKTALIYAILDKAVQKNGYNNYDYELINALTDKGANVNEKDNKGRTPLMYALMQKRTQDYYNYGIITFLIGKGANVNEKDAEGNTVLTYAKKYSSPEIIKILSDNGAK